MKRALLLGTLMALVSAPAAVAAGPDNIGIDFDRAAVVSGGALYRVTDGSCRFSYECQKLRRTDATTGKTTTVKQAKGRITGLQASDNALAFSEWDATRGRSTIYFRGGAGKFTPVVMLKRHAVHCDDAVVVNAVSDEGGVVWTRYINRGCRGNYRFEATRFVRWPGYAPVRLGAKRTVSDMEFDSGTDPSLNPEAASISKERVLYWDWPRAYLYDFVSGATSRLVSDSAWFDEAPVGLGPNGEVVVTRVVDRKHSVSAPVLHPNPVALAYGVTMREDGPNNTTFRFCGQRIITYSPFADTGGYSVRDLSGTVVSVKSFNAPGDDISIASIICDATTLVAELDDPDTEAGTRVAAVALP